MIRCYITNRKILRPGQRLEDVIAANLLSGTDWIQLREKDLSARELLPLAQRVLALPNPHASKILINSRVDIALAAGLDGVHLPAGSPAPTCWNQPTLLWGVSCHTVAEVREAEQNGATYAVIGPVFPPLSKDSVLPARGLSLLQQAARSVKIPVLALGGITNANAVLCVENGAAGVAGITLFQDPGT